MQRLRELLLPALALALAALAWALGRPEAPRVPAPRPSPPAPCPKDGPCPVPPAPAPKPKRPWGGLWEAAVGGPRHLDGTEVACDLPADLHVRNRGGADGKGLCVFASLRHAGEWHDEPVLRALFEWMFARPGGGWPEKV